MPKGFVVAPHQGNLALDAHHPEDFLVRYLFGLSLLDMCPNFGKLLWLDFHTELDEFGAGSKISKISGARLEERVAKHTQGKRPLLSRAPETTGRRRTEN